MKTTKEIISMFKNTEDKNKAKWDKERWEKLHNEIEEETLSSYCSLFTILLKKKEVMTAKEFKSFVSGLVLLLNESRDEVSNFLYNNKKELKK